MNTLLNRTEITALVKNMMPPSTIFCTTLAGFQLKTEGTTVYEKSCHLSQGISLFKVEQQTHMGTKASTRIRYGGVLEGVGAETHQKRNSFVKRGGTLSLLMFLPL